MSSQREGRKEGAGGVGRERKSVQKKYKIIIGRRKQVDGEKRESDD